MMNERLRLSFEPIAIFLAALVLRLVYLFLIVPTDPAHDSYHHWQIAYYSLHMGMPRGGRLWDLTGMEYFWGLFPTFTRMFLLWGLSTSSILPFRIFNAVLGSATAGLSYMIGLRHFGRFAARLASALVAFLPLTIFNSILGLNETIAAFFATIAIYLYHSRPYLSGLSLGLASMSRIEMGFLSVCVILFSVFERPGSLGAKATRTAPLALGWLTAMILNFLYIRAGTGDPLYQIRYNILGTLVGGFPWLAQPTAVTYILSYTFAGILILSIALLAILLRKVRTARGLLRHAVYLFFLSFLLYHGILYVIFQSTVLDPRLFVLDAVAGSLTISNLVGGRPFRKLVAILLIVLSIIPTSVMYVGAEVLPYRDELSYITAGFRTADFIARNYQGGAVISNIPEVNYQLVRSGRISPTSILGSIYAPRETSRALEWLREKDAVYIVSVTFPWDDLSLLFPYLTMGKSQGPFLLRHTEEFQNGYHIYVYEAIWR